MYASVKKNNSNKKMFEIQGEIPKKVLDYLASEYGDRFEMRASQKEFAEIFEKVLKKNNSNTPK